MRASERKKKLQRELRRVYRVLKAHPIILELRWLFDDRNLRGDYERRGENGYIRIDPFKMMVSTLVHEVYHHLEPKARHAKIYALEDFIIRSATPRQLKNLFGYLVLHWRVTHTDRRKKRAMPPCPLCGRKLPRVPGGSPPKRSAKVD